MRTLAAALLLACAAVRAGAAGSSEDALRESVLRLAAGDVAGAEAAARDAVQAEPANARALQQLARAANAALDFGAAENAASRALALGAPTPALLCLRSEARSGRGDFQGALEDADRAVKLNPASAPSALRVAIAKEGLRRSPEETLSDYRRAAELDPSLGRVLEAATARLDAPSRPRRGLGALIGLLGLSAIGGWALGQYRGRKELPPPAAPPAPVPAVIPGAGRLTPRQAARMLAAAAPSAPDADAARALAESLYERLTGRPPYPPDEADVARRQGRFTPPSAAADGLPVGIDSFFARALAPEASRRFRNGAELAGAFRSLADPAVD